MQTENLNVFSISHPDSKRKGIAANKNGVAFIEPHLCWLDANQAFLSCAYDGEDCLKIDGKLLIKIDWAISQTPNSCPVRIESMRRFKSQIITNFSSETN